MKHRAGLILKVRVSMTGNLLNQSIPGSFTSEQFRAELVKVLYRLTQSEFLLLFNYMQGKKNLQLLYLEKATFLASKCKWMISPHPSVLCSRKLFTEGKVNTEIKECSGLGL